MDANDSLSNLQFGFCRGRSTCDALRCVIEQAERAARGPARSRYLCAVVAIDVRNSFNSAPWLLVNAALQKRGFPGPSGEHWQCSVAVNRWMQENSFQVAPQKSEAVVLTNEWAYRDPTFILGGQQIPVKSSFIVDNLET
ncbi:hypothetical protein ACI65C_010675 [Semiaphis heraclei]